MIAKESVRSRLDRADVGISYTEFSYMLLQAYDFYRLHVDYGCELQLGGSDQWGNITMAIELVKQAHRRPGLRGDDAAAHQGRRHQARQVARSPTSACGWTAR